MTNTARGAARGRVAGPAGQRPRSRAARTAWREGRQRDAAQAAADLHAREFLDIPAGNVNGNPNVPDPFNGDTSAQSINGGGSTLPGAGLATDKNSLNGGGNGTIFGNNGNDSLISGDNLDPLAGAHEFILELPHGYDTEIGERGATLSVGQRQRIAIARALISDPRVLIFDEATSALDYESERVVQENMRAMARGRTVIIIAHRLAAVRGADRIITVERGRVVEDGTHEELVRSGGRYAGLWTMQVGAN